MIIVELASKLEGRIESKSFDQNHVQNQRPGCESVGAKLPIKFEFSICTKPANLLQCCRLVQTPTMNQLFCAAIVIHHNGCGKAESKAGHKNPGSPKRTSLA